MHRTTIMLPEALKARAERRARGLGTSLAGLIRQALEEYLSRHPPEASADALFAFDAVYDGPVPADTSSEHDRYLYGDEP